MTLPLALGVLEFLVVLVHPVISKNDINQMTCYLNTGINLLLNKSFRLGSVYELLFFMHVMGSEALGPHLAAVKNRTAVS